jgi:hypothetical protein
LLLINAFVTCHQLLDDIKDFYAEILYNLKIEAGRIELKFDIIFGENLLKASRDAY